MRSRKRRGVNEGLNRLRKGGVNPGPSENVALPPPPPPQRRVISPQGGALERNVRALPHDVSGFGWTIDLDIIEQVVEVAGKGRGYYGAEEAEEVMLAMVKLGYARLEASVAQIEADGRADLQGGKR